MEHPSNDSEAEYLAHHPFYRELEDVEHADHVIRLVRPDMSHAPHSLEWLSDAEVGQHMGADFSGLSIATEEERLRKIIESTDEYNWMIELDGKVVGNACINSIKEQSDKKGHRAGSMAILIGDKKAWGKKIARSVNTAVLDWAFNEAYFESLLARIKEENVGSIKSFAALGFEHTGNETENEHGKILHWQHYTMTKEKWLQGAIE